LQSHIHKLYHSKASQLGDTENLGENPPLGGLNPTTLSNSANCTVLRAVVLTQYWRVTHGETHRRTDRQTELP